MRPSRKASHSECRARAGDGDYKLIFHFLRDLSNLTKTHASQVSARVSKDTIHLFPSRFSSISEKLNYSLGEIDFLLSPRKHPNTQSHWLKFRCACAKCGILEFHPGREKCGRPSTWQAGASGRQGALLLLSLSSSIHRRLCKWVEFTRTHAGDVQCDIRVSRFRRYWFHSLLWEWDERVGDFDSVSRDDPRPAASALRLFFHSSLSSEAPFFQTAHTSIRREWKAPQCKLTPNKCKGRYILCVLLKNVCKAAPLSGAGAIYGQMLQLFLNLRVILPF